VHNIQHPNGILNLSFSLVIYKVTKGFAVEFVGSGQGDNHMFERFLNLQLAHLQINVLFPTNSSLLMSLAGDFCEIGMSNLHVEDVYLDQRLLGGYQGPPMLRKT
jgi:hypothetical protein